VDALAVCVHRTGNFALHAMVMEWPLISRA
jgi:hypothetical protein